MNGEIIGISLYVVGMILMGGYVSRRIKTSDDYFLAGRSLGPGLATFSIFATWFGAETCIGTAGAVYKKGIATIHADPVGYSLCLLIMGLFFAKILWKKRITTIPDLFRERYAASTEKLGALILIPSSIIWAGAQVRALGQVLQSTTTLSPTIAVTIAAVVVIIYTMSGGLLADAYADFIQGIAIITGLAFLTFALVMDAGGPISAFESIPAEKFTFGHYLSDVGFLGRLELWMVPILGSLMSQELVSRVVASKSDSVARRSSLRAALMYFLVGCMPVIIGLLSVKILPNITDAESVMPAVARIHLHPFFYIIFVGALVSAILSTVDTTLLSSSALLSSNLVYPHLKNPSSKTKVLIARLGTLSAGIISYLIAFSSESIVGLVEMAASLGGPSILVITMMALWEKKGNHISANFSLVMSLITWIISHGVFEIEFPILLTVAVCMLSYVGTLPFTVKVGAELEV